MVLGIMVLMVTNYYYMAGCYEPQSIRNSCSHEPKCIMTQSNAGIMSSHGQQSNRNRTLTPKNQLHDNTAPKGSFNQSRHWSNTHRMQRVPVIV